MFHNRYSQPTPHQFELIGRVVSSWAVVEYCLEAALAGLIGAPVFPSLAITNGLGPDNRLQALSNLIEMHKDRYGCRIVSEANLILLETLRKEVAKHKSERNKFAHYIWMRMSDEELFGIRIQGKVLKDMQKGSGVIRKNTEVAAFAAELHQLGERFGAHLQSLPTEDERDMLQRLQRV